MIRKFRAGLALQPVGIFLLSSVIIYLLFSNNPGLFVTQIATAIFANSPFKEGKPNGFLSLRRYY